MIWKERNGLCHGASLKNGIYEAFEFLPEIEITRFLGEVLNISFADTIRL